jgi:hypothetical protein
MKAAHRAAAGALGLGESQRWLFSHVTRRRPLLLGADVALITAGGLPALARLEIYRHGYFARLVECLADDYPALAYALGPAAFDELCNDYIEAHPPLTPSLNFFGAELSSFCARRSEALGFEVELARLEWAVVEAIHADATTMLDPSAFGALGEEQWARARLVPSPALRLLRGSYPVHGYYRAFLEGESPSRPVPQPSAIAVCRRDDDVWRLALEPPLAELLEGLMGGERLAAALERVTGDAAAGVLGAGAVERAFGDWVQCGFFAALAID